MRKSPLFEQDQHARLQALDITQSFIIQAPAGSGKTEILIQRFLALLASVQSPDEILAITFTKKAAHEMRMRIIKALKNAATHQEPTTTHEQKTWELAKRALARDEQFNWNILKTPNQLRIQTIDSLCTYLTKQLPLLSHFGATPKISEHPLHLYSEAVTEILSHIESTFPWQSSISKLLVHLDNDLNKCHDLLVQLLCKRDQWLNYLSVDTSDINIKHALEYFLRLIIEEHLSNLHQLFSAVCSERTNMHLDSLSGGLAHPLMTLVRFAANNLISDSENMHDQYAHYMNLSQMIDLPTHQLNDLSSWLFISNLLITKSNTWRKRLDQTLGFPPLNQIKNTDERQIHQHIRDSHQALLAQLMMRDDIFHALNNLHYLPNAEFSESQWHMLHALLYVLKMLVAQLRITFQQHGEIDFIENAQAALTALGTDEYPTDLILALDYQIKHILVDEFQDTSITQYKLLEKLIEGWEKDDGRTLFVVGDPMQSIYRFREAEVGLFIRMYQHSMRHLKLIPLSLSINFRSQEKIIAWNNHYFSHIFPKHSDIATGAVHYSPSVAHADERFLKKHEVIIQGFEETNARSTQAHYILTICKNKLTQEPNQSIAILVRSRAHLTQIIPLLKKEKIPFQAVDIDPLIGRQTIQDLLSLTCALHNTSDRIAWLAILRAPWCGLRLNDLLIIAKENKYAPIWQILHDPQHIYPKLSEDGQKRLQRIIPILTFALNNRGRAQVRDWIEHTWFLLGGPACLSDLVEMDEVNVFFNSLEEYDAKVHIFSVDTLKEKIQHLYAPPLQQDASLKLMTIHSAKGLEFDTVIVPHLEAKAMNDDRPLFLWMEQPLTQHDRSALFISPIHAIGTDKDNTYEYIYRIQKLKMNYETERLFYVATTRAKHQLYLLFDAIKTTSEHKKQNIKIEQGSFLQKLWPHLHDPEQQLILKDEIVSDDNHIHKPKKYLLRFNAQWENQVVNINRDTELTTHHKKEGFNLYDRTDQIMGIIIHNILQQLAQLGIKWWQAQNDDSINRYIKQQLVRSGMPSSQFTDAKRCVKDAINNTLNDARGLWILHPHREAQSEMAITALIEYEPQHLIIDRTFVDENNVRWIIDYKTTTCLGNDVHTFLSTQYEKYKTKMTTYAQAFQYREQRKICLGLYFPTLPAFKEWEG